MPDNPTLARINALTANARTTWFALLGTLVFVGITLMGVEHIDFYGTDRATKLPLVDVSVPTRYFFIAAPILTAAIYGYFQLYLIRLWDALGAAPARIGGERLGDAIAPWLVTDAALHLRNTLRDDNCTLPRAMEVSAMSLNIALGWLLGPVVLALVWWMSMPARLFWMTGIAGLALILALFTGVTSFALLLRRMRSPELMPNRLRHAVQVHGIGLLLVLPAVLVPSFLRTNGSAAFLAPISLGLEEVVERPDTWLPFDIARTEFRATWCRREGVEDCANLGPREADFREEWLTRRFTALAELPKPDWSKVQRAKPDFREAALAGAFLSGADLQQVRLQGAFLPAAQLEGAFLNGADLTDAHMSGAALDIAFLDGATLTRTMLARARMERASLHNIRIDGAQMSETVLDGADFTQAMILNAEFGAASLRGANFSRAVVFGNPAALAPRTDLAGLPLIGAGVDLADLRGARFEGALLHNLDFTTAQLDPYSLLNSMADGTVRLPEGMARPCQWSDAPLQTDELMGRWRGWLESDAEAAAWVSPWLAGVTNFTAIPPPEGCHWRSLPPGAARLPPRLLPFRQ
ncbi:pentapeptide repeat-containing protein [Vannielia litorea]|uniref:pentapeptide repeat-containing protein n=1 Tax=Vannielia litorea TaxID=1217970 RepID=UPI001BCF489B|nr:pentapeptide repeat-containing protein [Vannielia litorea]MBS8227456.1 pentapeptide repeat-containing protein [Vannielia litorea]